MFFPEGSSIFSQGGRGAGGRGSSTITISQALLSQEGAREGWGLGNQEVVPLGAGALGQASFSTQSEVGRTPRTGALAV